MSRMSYTEIIFKEREKLALLYAKYALIANQIAETEQFIAVLEKRVDQSGDELDRVLERKIASKSAGAVQPAMVEPGVVVSLQAAEVPVTESATPDSGCVFPVFRSDSVWPYLARYMVGKPRWSLSELSNFAITRKLSASESGVRSTISSLKKWDMLTSDMPGYYSLTPKGHAFVNTLKPLQFVLIEPSQDASAVDDK